MSGYFSGMVSVIKKVLLVLEEVKVLYRCR